jgi:hypothetical protein
MNELKERSHLPKLIPGERAHMKGFTDMLKYLKHSKKP